MRLLQLCAFFAPEPISGNLLYSKEMIEALKPYDASLQEKLVLGRVIREIGRFALAKVDQVSNSIQVHRLVQAVIRAQLSEEEQQDARHVVHRILAGARPDDDEPIDNPSTWPQFATIWPHLGPSDARNCKEPEARRLLIDRVRYLWKRGDFRTATTLCEELRALWKETLGSGTSSTSTSASTSPTSTARAAVTWRRGTGRDHPQCGSGRCWAPSTRTRT